MLQAAVIQCRNSAVTSAECRNPAVPSVEKPVQREKQQYPIACSSRTGHCVSRKIWQCLKYGQKQFKFETIVINKGKNSSNNQTVSSELRQKKYPILKKLHLSFFFEKPLTFSVLPQPQVFRLEDSFHLGLLFFLSFFRLDFGDWSLLLGCWVFFFFFLKINLLRFIYLFIFYKWASRLGYNFRGA